MKLSELIADLNILQAVGSTEIEIAGLSEDSRTISSGFIFFAREGEKTSGYRYISEAIDRGAVAVISEKPIPAISVPWIQVASIREAVSKVSARFYDFPSQDLIIVGVTGTNGKTTFTYLLESIARGMGWRTGLIGTIESRVPQLNSDEVEILHMPNTTPNALELGRILSLMRNRKTDLVVMEVSSHALELGRVDSIEFDGVVFTNLSQDHLDFHKTMENYFLAKAKLFQMIAPAPKNLTSFPEEFSAKKFCIINADDPYGKRIASFSKIPAKSYGIKNPADLMAQEISLSPQGSSFFLVCAKKKFHVLLPLIGQHNIYNALSASLAAMELGIPLDRIVQALQHVGFIPGRLEPIDCGQSFTVLVDYAHTEDALQNVLQSLKGITYPSGISYPKPLSKKRILTLFGCGGDRDRSKRPRMGAVAANLSDWVIVTSDNPRSEDPAQIALDIEVGIQRIGKKNYEVIIDREEAIKKILRLAQKEDIVLIAGKGHETYQIFSDHTIEFDDREIVRKILCSR